jgi:chemotaxis protein MotA
MLVFVGIVVVFGAVVGGYLMEHGKLAVLWQPAEVVIIVGAAMGSLLVANPLPVLKKAASGLVGVIKGNRYTKKRYLETLQMLNALFASARKGGATKLEADVDDPQKSDVFKRFPFILQDHHTLDFLCDTLRLSVTGGIDPFQLDQMMELDLDVHHEEAGRPVSALTTVADSLPGLGIVAAVLGVVITMGALGGPAEEIGHKVGAALVGTFLGILLCYGLFGPLAAHMGKISDIEGRYYHVLRVAVLAFARGNAPMLAVEFARRAIPHEVRPSFKEMEAACRGGGVAAAPAPAQAA